MAGQDAGDELRATKSARPVRPAQSLAHNLVVIVHADCRYPNWKATLDQRLREATASYTVCRIVSQSDHIKRDGLVLRRAFCKARL